MVAHGKTSVGEITALLAAEFDLARAAGWDPVGLQFGDPAASVSRVAVCHEITQDVATRVIQAGVDLLVTYHPLLFRPTTTLIAGPSAAGRAFELIRAGIAVVATHTAFDTLAGGTADSLAQALGLEETAGFAPAWGRDSVKVVTFVPEPAADAVADAMASAGAGNIGRYAGCSYRSSGEGTFRPLPGASPVAGTDSRMNREPEVRIEMVAPERSVDAIVAALVAAHPYEEPAYDIIASRSNAGFFGRRGTLGHPMSMEELSRRVAEALGGVVRVAGSGEVESVAVIPGSGGGMLGSVAADVVVTGDVSHHQARDALTRNIRIIDPGHAATERPGVQSLYAAVAELVTDAIDMTDIDADPWKER